MGFYECFYTCGCVSCASAKRIHGKLYCKTLDYIIVCEHHDSQIDEVINDLGGYGYNILDEWISGSMNSISRDPDTAHIYDRVISEQMLSYGNKFHHWVTEPDDGVEQQ